MPSVYIHIPFCLKKCLYCDFYSVTETEQVEAFLDALTHEVTLSADRYKDTETSTIFFGGGTPSLLEPSQIERILIALGTVFRIVPDAEVTLEANPGTVTREKLRVFRALGINRLSLGIQSFLDAELHTLGRVHDRAEALRSVGFARAAAFDDISLDLIYAIPGQNVASWEETLRAAVELTPQHISAYSLTVEDGTPLSRLVQAGEVRMTPSSLQDEMFEQAHDFLNAHGYEHYEVSNYALPGLRCRHNCNYWSHENYLGFGPSAHSFWKDIDGKGGRRSSNVEDLAAYVARLKDGQMPVGSEEHVGPDELIHERIFLGLRSSGLNLARLRQDLGYDIVAHRGDVIRNLLDERLALLEGDLLRLTPGGYLVCDEICERLFP